MRTRHADDGHRARLIRQLQGMIAAHPDLVAEAGDRCPFPRQLEQLEAGEAVRVPGWSVGRPDLSLARLEADDSVTPIRWVPASLALP